MLVTCRVKGVGKKTRELTATFDHNYAYCLMMRKDAIDLGYSNASYPHGSWLEFRPDEAPLVLGLRGVERTILIALKEVSVGELKAEDVDTVVLEYDQPPLMPFDIVLGWSYLKNFKFAIDPTAETLTIDK